MTADPDSMPEIDPALARTWREASGEEPPPQLDGTIRAAARRAVHAGPRPARATFARRWGVPLSIAALIVVSASVTLMISQRDAHLPGAPAEQPATRARDQAKQRAQPDTAVKAEAKRAQPSAGAAATPSPAKSTDLAVGAGTNRQEAMRQDAPAEAEARATPAASASLPEATPAPAAEPASPAPEERALRDEAKRSAPPPLPETMPSLHGPETGTAQGAASSTERFERALEPLPGAADSAQPERDLPNRARLKLQSRPAAPLHTEAGEEAAPSAPLPEQWLEQIRELKRMGQLTEAEASLKQFRERYPEYALPADLAPPH